MKNLVPLTLLCFIAAPDLAHGGCRKYLQPLPTLQALPERDPLLRKMEGRHMRQFLEYNSTDERGAFFQARALPRANLTDGAIMKILRRGMNDFWTAHAEAHPWPENQALELKLPLRDLKGRRLPSWHEMHEHYSNDNRWIYSVEAKKQSLMEYGGVVERLGSVLSLWWPTNAYSGNVFRVLHPLNDGISLMTPDFKRVKVYQLTKRVQTRRHDQDGCYVVLTLTAFIKGDRAMIAHTYDARREHCENHKE
jgi:hypothetical protein